MKFSFIHTYAIFIIGTLIFSWLINHIFLRFVRSLGIRNPEERVLRWNEKSKPSIGGLSFYIIFLLSISCFAFAFSTGRSVLNFRESGILLACTLGFLMGLADDAYDTRPILKSLTQVMCAIILVITGSMIQLFDSYYLNATLTVIWVIGIMNAVNMLDNMDGITGSVSLIILLTILSCSITSSVNPDFYFILVSGMICALTAFLYFNWHPSKLFMGDSGSQFLGIFLAVIGIIYFWNLEPLHGDKVTIPKKILLPLLAFIVPIADTTTVVINRISGGKSPFIGGKDHTTHNLARIGLSDAMVAFVVSLISAISGVIIIFVYNGSSFGKELAIALSVYILSVFILLFSVTRMKRSDQPHPST